MPHLRFIIYCFVWNSTSYRKDVCHAFLMSFKLIEKFLNYLQLVVEDPHMPEREPERWPERGPELGTKRDPEGARDIPSENPNGSSSIGQGRGTKYA